MFKNYFRAALRNFRKSRMYSAINISGLSLGMAIALLIGIWIWDELSFDTYHSNYPHIAQVMENQSLSGGVATMNVLPYPLGKTLRQKYPGDFQRVASFIAYPEMIAVGNKKLSKTGSFADPEFPDMMTLKMTHGSRSGITDPSSILISGSLATAIFGDTDPVGKTLRLGDKYELQVKGVYEDLPENSSFSGLDFLAPMHLLFRGHQKEDYLLPLEN